MQRCETVTFSRDNYKSDIEFWIDIQAVVRALLRTSIRWCVDRKSVATALFPPLNSTTTAATAMRMLIG